MLSHPPRPPLIALYPAALKQESVSGASIDTTCSKSTPYVLDQTRSSAYNGLLRSLRILAAKQGVKINTLLEEAIRDILKKYKEQPQKKSNE